MTSRMDFFQKVVRKLNAAGLGLERALTADHSAITAEVFIRGVGFTFFISPNGSLNGNRRRISLPSLKSVYPFLDYEKIEEIASAFFFIQTESSCFLQIVLDSDEKYTAILQTVLGSLEENWETVLFPAVSSEDDPAKQRGIVFILNDAADPSPEAWDVTFEEWLAMDSAQREPHRLGVKPNAPGVFPIYRKLYRLDPEQLVGFFIPFPEPLKSLLLGAHSPRGFINIMDMRILLRELEK